VIDWPWCAKCEVAFKPQDHLTATVVRKDDGKARSQAILYHTACWTPEEHPTQVVILRDHPSVLDPAADA